MVRPTELELTSSFPNDPVADRCRFGQPAYHDARSRIF
jgi:hypothetical protein